MQLTHGCEPTIPSWLHSCSSSTTTLRSCRHSERSSSRQGIELLGATSFEDGKRLLADTPPPAMLITDVRLGMFNGLQLAVLRPPTTGVIVISGFLDPTLDAETRRLGGVYMLKPVSARSC